MWAPRFPRAPADDTRGAAELRRGVRSEIRIDPLSGAPVLVAPGRRRIGAARPAGLPTPEERCPFCVGHEADTEETVLALGDPWRLRVVANRFPVLEAEAHDVVVETREHGGDLARYDAATVRDVLLALRARVRHHEARPGVRAVTAFRNRGRRAGSSQPHPHSQVVALPFVPPAMAARDAIAARDPQLFARLVEEERRDGARVVADGEGWLTFTPYAPSRSFEVRLGPTAPTPRFSALTDAQLDALGPRLVDACARALEASGVTDYNVLVRDPAVGAGAYFTIDVLPRSGGDAGFEILTGTAIVTVTPEDAAEALRRVRR